MKKKIVSLMVSGILSVVFILASCGGRVIEQIDKDKTQIYVSVYNGGYGTEWLNPIKNQFETDYPDYQIMIKPTSDDDLTATTAALNYNVYFTTTSTTFKTIISKGLLADVSDIYEKTLPGETLKVKEKVSDYDTLKKAFSYPGKTGLYALPYTNSITGIVYDHQLFKENIDNGWLYKAELSEKSKIEEQGISVKEEDGKLKFVSSEYPTNYEINDVILRAGRDGKYGTYDDGQPITEKEWKDVLTRISMNTARKAKPITYSDNYAYEYTLPIFLGELAQYEGEENFRLFYSCEGTYKHGTDSKTITPQEGYKVYEMKGIEKSLQFYDTYVCGDNYSNVEKDSDHLAAQNKFILWNKISKNEYASPMLIEGVWWENEAKVNIEAMDDPAYEYGKRDYRYMLLPYLDGQVGVKEGKGSALVSQDYGLTLVSTNGGDKVIEMSKKFVEYTLRDANLQEFTATTGVIRPYKYELTDEHKNRMTKFQRNVMEMMMDTDNISILTPALYRYLSPICFATELAVYNTKCRIKEDKGVAIYYYPSDLRSRVSGYETYYSGLKDYYSSNWNSIYDSAKKFYE